MVMLDTILMGTIGALVVAKLAVMAVVVYWSIRGILDQGKSSRFVPRTAPVMCRHPGRSG